MDFKTLQKHCPNAKYVSKAVLPNFQVQFNFLSKTYGGGVTGVESAPGKLAKGVIYDLPLDEMEHLDKIEAVPEGLYYRQKVLAVDEEGDLLEVYTYRTTNPKGPYKPTKKYMELMIKGAKEHGLDPEYIKFLENTSTIDK